MRFKNLIYINPEGLFLFLSALFIRFPFFFRDYIDQDESTFILMGQSIADGHLPYDYLWDLKPPLLFYLFAFIEKLFPHSFIAIRFVGVLVVFVSALLLMKIAKQANLKNGFLVAIGYVVLSSEFGSLQGVMSEHFAVLFILLALVFFLRNDSYHNFLIAGLAYGCAILCKLNYAYAVMALMIFYFVAEWRKRNTKQAFVRSFILLLGIIIPVTLTAIPFIAAGKFDLYINSVFLAPLEYARALQYDWSYKLKVSWWLILLTALVCCFALKFSREENKKVVWVSTAILAGTVYTFYSSGIINGHYLVQVYPFLLLLLFGVIVPKKIYPKLSMAIAIIILLSFESILEYYRLIRSIKDPAEYRSTFEVIRELKKRNLEDDKIFFADYHIGYWLLNQYPLTKSTTHPSNIARPYLFKYYDDSSSSSMDELKYIMEKVKPEVIVSESSELDYFPDNSLENQYFKKNISQDFEMIYSDTTDRIFIWERTNN